GPGDQRAPEWSGPLGGLLHSAVCQECLAFLRSQELDYQEKESGLSPHKRRVATRRGWPTASRPRVPRRAWVSGPVISRLDFRKACLASGAGPEGQAERADRAARILDQDQGLAQREPGGR